MPTYIRNTYRYNLRNTNATRNGIRKSLGLPGLPFRRWSDETSSPFSESTGNSFSEFSIESDENEDEEREARHDQNKGVKPVELESTFFRISDFPMILVIVVLVCLREYTAIIIAITARLAVYAINKIDVTVQRREVKRLRNFQRQQRQRQRQRRRQQREEAQRLRSIESYQRLADNQGRLVDGCWWETRREREDQRWREVDQRESEEEMRRYYGYNYGYDMHGWEGCYVRLAGLDDATDV